MQKLSYTKCGDYFIPRNMYLRPDYYIAYEEAQTLIYKSANPNYDPDVDRTGDFCYWDVLPVNGAEFTVARKLLLEAEQDKNQ